ncbi:MAG: hypothetical protein ACKVVP_22900 [Chloroflexota bacterium]
MFQRLQRLLRPTLAAVILIAGLAAAQPPLPSAAQLDSRYYSDTGFRVDSDPFWEIFDKLGKQRGLGMPVSRTFRLLGRPTQIFQRGMLQIAPEGHAYIVSMLQDQLLFPYRSINGSVFPQYDAGFVTGAPLPGTEDYDLGIIAYLKQSIPDEFDGQPVKFMENYLSAVRERDADLDVLANLPVWGIPTSPPTRDPANPRVIYQRFERGMLVYEAGCRCTRVLPLGDLFKATLTGQFLPADFESQEPNSPFLRQYDTDGHQGPIRKIQLPDTDLANAFLPSAKEPVSWATIQEIVPPPPDPFAYAVAPTSTPVNQVAPLPVATFGTVVAATAPPSPTTAVGPFTRDPSVVALQAGDIGKEATVVKSQTGTDSRGRWYEVRYERDRSPESLGLGPSIWYQKVWVASSPELARSIYRDEAANTSFPESVDRYRGFFFIDLPRLVEEQQQMASCEEEGCSATRYFVHLRTILRNANVVSVIYTYGDQQYSGGPDVLPNIRKVSDRMRA